MSPITEHHDVVVVGGGQAGLAAGRVLAEQGRDFTIVEAAAQPAAAWRNRWESLQLFTPVRYSSLPGRPFPGDPDAYPMRDDVVAYLTDYARDLPVELDSPVSSVRPADGGGYAVELPGRTYGADQVIVATGPFQVPRVPAFAAGLSSDVVQMHSADYRAPADLPPGPVVVVGGGNTGFQIAAELSATHEVHLSIGSRQAPLPQRLFGRDTFRWLDATGLMNKNVESRLARRLKDRETLVGMSPRKLRRSTGVRLQGRTVAASGHEVVLEDGARLTASSVIWATGFGLDHSFVDLPVFDERGAPVHRRGVTEAPGLYFLGLPWQWTRGSALLGWVGQDARFIAERIAAFRPSERPGTPAAAPAPVERVP
jgi:putative flavoprotein involved in K+ transport